MGTRTIEVDDSICYNEVCKCFSTKHASRCKANAIGGCDTQFDISFNSDGVPPVGELPAPAAPGADGVDDSLFQHLWTKAVGTKDYDKKEWQQLEKQLQAHPAPLRPLSKAEGDKYVAAIAEENKDTLRELFLLTVGSGDDGDEWRVLSVHATWESAEAGKREYETSRTRQDGSTYHYDANIETWDLL